MALLLAVFRVAFGQFYESCWSYCIYCTSTPSLHRVYQLSDKAGQAKFRVYWHIVFCFACGRAVIIQISNEHNGIYLRSLPSMILGAELPLQWARTLFAATIACSLSPLRKIWSTSTSGRSCCDIVSESDSDNPDDYLPGGEAAVVLNKKNAAIRCKCQNKKTVGILAKFPDIRKEIERFVEEAWVQTHGEEPGCSRSMETNK